MAFAENRDARYRLPVHDHERAAVPCGSSVFRTSSARPTFDCGRGFPVRRPRFPHDPTPAAISNTASPTPMTRGNLHKNFHISQPSPTSETSWTRRSARRPLPLSPPRPAPSIAAMRRLTLLSSRLNRRWGKIRRDWEGEAPAEPRGSNRLQLAASATVAARLEPRPPDRRLGAHALTS